MMKDIKDHHLQDMERNCLIKNNHTLICKSDYNLLINMNNLIYLYLSQKEYYF